MHKNVITASILPLGWRGALFKPIDDQFDQQALVDLVHSKQVFHLH